MIKWLEKIDKTMKIEKNVAKLLILDKCSSHLKPTIMTSVKGDDSFLDYIPAGCTSLVQPLDLMVSKPFKDILRTYYEEWLSKEGLLEKNKTKKGYIKAPSDVLIIKWVKNAWESIDSELIKRSFKFASIFCLKTKEIFFLGLTTNYFGGEEDLMKPELRDNAQKSQEYLKELLRERRYLDIDAELSDWNVEDLDKIDSGTTSDLEGNGDCRIEGPDEIACEDPTAADSDSSSSGESNQDLDEEDEDEEKHEVPPTVENENKDFGIIGMIEDLGVIEQEKNPKKKLVTKNTDKKECASQKKISCFYTKK